MTRSLQFRLLVAAAAVLVAFLGLTGFVLDRAFRESAEAAAHDRLQAQVYALLAAADLDAKSVLQMPKDLPEPRLGVVGSGLYAEILKENGSVHWRSASALGIDFPQTGSPRIGQWRFYRVQPARGAELFVLDFGLNWEDSARELQRFSFRTAESLDGYYAQVTRFRRSLWGWLVAVGVLLLAVQSTILRWGLSPLRRVADDLRAIETGAAKELTGEYPTELRGLTGNLNSLITSARSHLDRHRDALGNLAHSLKTPLAVLRNAMSATSGAADLPRTVREQVDRMDQIVDYQLKRAAVSGRTTLSAPIQVAVPARKVISALTKVYGSKTVECELKISGDARFYGDESDLLEVLGNLADNAFKWCQNRILIHAAPASGSGHEMRRVQLRVEDDGPGIADAFIEIVRHRGERADATTPGHGIGLAMVQDIVRLYGGEMKIGRSGLGGAAVEVLI